MWYKSNLFGNTASKDGYLHRVAIGFIEKKNSFESQKRQGQCPIGHQRITDNGVGRVGHRARSKPVERELSVTSLDNTCRDNEDDTPTIRREYAAGSEKSDTSESPSESENSQKSFPIVTSLAADMILISAHMDENIEKIGTTKGEL